jgi:hypothetical protein
MTGLAGRPAQSRPLGVPLERIPEILRRIPGRLPAGLRGLEQPTAGQLTAGQLYPG